MRRTRPKISEVNPYYLVYPDGRIWSLITDRFLKPYLNQKRYLRVKLHGEYGPYQYFVSRLVAMSFCKLPAGYSFDDLQVDHDDMNKYNNHYTNLFWVTDLENKKKRKAYLKKNWGMIKGGSKEEMGTPF